MGDLRNSREGKVKMKTIAKLKFGLVAFQILFHFDSVMAYPEPLSQEKVKAFLLALTDLKSLHRNFKVMGISPRTVDYEDFVNYWDSMQEIVKRYGFKEWREYIVQGAVITETYFTMNEKVRTICLEEMRSSLKKMLENSFLNDEDKENAVEILRLTIKQVESGPPSFQLSEKDCFALEPHLTQLDELYSFKE